MKIIFLNRNLETAPSTDHNNHISRTQADNILGIFYFRFRTRHVEFVTFINLFNNLPSMSWVKPAFSLSHICLALSNMCWYLSRFFAKASLCLTMAASVQEESDDLSTCSVCLEPYDKELRKPKLLFCGHTNCLQCVKVIFKLTIQSFDLFCVLRSCCCS